MSIKNQKITAVTIGDLRIFWGIKKSLDSTTLEELQYMCSDSVVLAALGNINPEAEYMRLHPNYEGGNRDSRRALLNHMRGQIGGIAVTEKDHLISNPNAKPPADHLMMTSSEETKIINPKGGPSPPTDFPNPIVNVSGRSRASPQDVLTQFKKEYNFVFITDLGFREYNANLKYWKYAKKESILKLLGLFILKNNYWEDFSTRSSWVELLKIDASVNCISIVESSYSLFAFKNGVFDFQLMDHVDMPSIEDPSQIGKQPIPLLGLALEFNPVALKEETFCLFSELSSHQRIKINLLRSLGKSLFIKPKNVLAHYSISHAGSDLVSGFLNFLKFVFESSHKEIFLHFIEQEFEDLLSYRLIIIRNVDSNTVVDNYVPILLKLQSNNKFSIIIFENELLGNFIENRISRAPLANTVIFFPINNTENSLEETKKTLTTDFCGVISWFMSSNLEIKSASEIRHLSFDLSSSVFNPSTLESVFTVWFFSNYVISKNPAGIPLGLVDDKHTTKKSSDKRETIYKNFLKWFKREQQDFPIVTTEFTPPVFRNLFYECMSHFGLDDKDYIGKDPEGMTFKNIALKPKEVAKLKELLATGDFKELQWNYTSVSSRFLNEDLLTFLKLRGEIGRLSIELPSEIIDCMYNKAGDFYFSEAELLDAKNTPKDEGKI